eukprot:Colp12_sorted_trinity150504_noHs@17430
MPNRLPPHDPSLPPPGMNYAPNRLPPHDPGLPPPGMDKKGPGAGSKKPSKGNTQSAAVPSQALVTVWNHKTNTWHAVDPAVASGPGYVVDQQGYMRMTQTMQGGHAPHHPGMGMAPNSMPVYAYQHTQNHPVGIQKISTGDGLSKTAKKKDMDTGKAKEKLTMQKQNPVPENGKSKENEKEVELSQSSKSQETSGTAGPPRWKPREVAELLTVCTEVSFGIWV